MINQLKNSIESNFSNCIQLLMDKCESEIEKLFMLKIIDYVLKRPDRYNFGFVFCDTDTEIINGVEVVGSETNFYLPDGFGNLYGFRIYNLIYHTFVEIFPQMKVELDNPENIYRPINFRLDFGINKYTTENPKNIVKKYCIECDGFDFHNTKDQIKKDNQRNRDLMLLTDITTLRYLGTEIYNMNDKDVGKFLWNL